MATPDIKTQIETHITNGDTAAAIESLVEYTKSTNEEQHENAMMLSGQFKQWQREKMLGVEQSDSELRRIEMGILAILKGQAMNDAGGMTYSSPRSTSGSGGVSRTGLIIGGVIGILVIALLAWMLGRETGSHHQEAGAGGDPAVVTSPAEQPTETPAAVTSPAEQPTDAPAAVTSPAEQPTEVPAANTSGETTILRAGQSLTMEQKYYSNDRNFYVRFGSDGNLCVYRKDDRFVAGSYQLGKPLDGVTAKMQDDGNFVVYGVGNKFIWASETHPLFDKRFNSKDMKPVRLVLENDGTLALYSGTNRKVWTLTGGKL